MQDGRASYFCTRDACLKAITDKIKSAKPSDISDTGAKETKAPEGLIRHFKPLNPLKS